LNGNQQKQVKIQENQGKEGEFSISFTLTTAGQHLISFSHKGKRFTGRKKENSRFRSLPSLLVSTRSLFLTREGISREVRLGLRLLIDLFIVVISTLLEPTLFFNLVLLDQEMASLAIH